MNDYICIQQGTVVDIVFLSVSHIRNSEIYFYHVEEKISLHDIDLYSFRHLAEVAHLTVSHLD